MCEEGPMSRDTTIFLPYLTPAKRRQSLELLYLRKQHKHSS